MFRKNILIRIRETFADMFNNMHKLPRLVVVLSDKVFVKFGASQDQYLTILKWLTTEHYSCVQAHKNHLPEKHFRNSEPKYLFPKPVSKYEFLNVEDKNRDSRRFFNHNSEKCMKKLKYFFAINIDGTVPNDANLFGVLMGSLSMKGYEVFWSNVNAIIKRVDSDLIRQHKPSTTKVTSGKKSIPIVDLTEIGSNYQSQQFFNQGIEQQNPNRFGTLKTKTSWHQYDMHIYHRNMVNPHGCSMCINHTPVPPPFWKPKRFHRGANVEVQGKWYFCNQQVRFNDNRN